MASENSSTDEGWRPITNGIDRPLFSEILWDLIDHARECSIDDMIAELDEAISCLEKRRA